MWKHLDKRPRGSPMFGVLFLLLGLVLFNIADAAAKLMTYHVSIPQVVWSLCIWMILLSWFMVPGRRVLSLVRTAHPWLQIARGGLELGAGLLFVTALRYLPFADVIAIGFVAPFFVTALAAVVLKESVGSGKWVACAFGFLGTLIILRPGFEAFQWASLLPVGAAVAYSFYAIITRLLAPREPATTMLFYVGITGAVALMVPLPFVWVAPAPIEWLGLAVVGLFGAAGHLVTIRAYSLAPASLLQPIHYLEIVGAAALGLVIFSDFPDVWTWVGAAVIIVSGVIFYGREARRSKSAGTTPPNSTESPGP
jgi:S-adenosylmethionine uptake transporter